MTSLKILSYYQNLQLLNVLDHIHDLLDKTVIDRYGNGKGDVGPRKGIQK